jgi:hypothetical protein
LQIVCGLQWGKLPDPRRIFPERVICGDPWKFRYGSMLLKKSLMRSLEPSDQLLRAFFLPALRPPVWPDWRV